MPHGGAAPDPSRLFPHTTQSCALPPAQQREKKGWGMASLTRGRITLLSTEPRPLTKDNPITFTNEEKGYCRQGVVTRRPSCVTVSADGRLRVVAAPLGHLPSVYVVVILRTVGRHEAGHYTI